MCDICGEREGKLHVFQFIEGKQKELYVCYECAATVGIGEQLGNERVVLESSMALEHKCPLCGWRLKDIIDTGMLGCPNCYDEFRQEVVPLLKHFHGENCLRENLEIHTEKKLTTLQWQLRRAVNEERFEDAAYFRDLIGRIEKKKPFKSGQG